MWSQFCLKSGKNETSKNVQTNILNVLQITYESVCLPLFCPFSICLLLHFTTLFLFTVNHKLPHTLYYRVYVTISTPHMIVVSFWISLWFMTFTIYTVIIFSEQSNHYYPSIQSAIALWYDSKHVFVGTIINEVSILRSFWSGSESHSLASAAV